MIKFMLNLHKSGNYAFFCPVSRLHLTVSNPIGFANEVTSYILRGLKSNVIIQLEDDNTEKHVEKKSSPSSKSEEPKVDIDQPKEPEAPAVEDKSEPTEVPVEETQEQKEEKTAKKPTQKKKK